MGRKGGKRLRDGLRLFSRLKECELMQTYLTKGTCSRQILFDVNENDEVINVKFIGGCSGNLQGISKLVQGKKVDEVIDLLSGIKCRSNTSCPDQLATALKEYKEKTAEK